MTPEKCRLCGSKFTGMFKVDRPCPETERDALVYDIHASDLCIACCAKEAEQAEIKRRLAIDHLENQITLLNIDITKEIEAIEATNLNNAKIPVFTTPHPYQWNAEIKGIVTGYCVLGTGLVSGVISEITDFFGAESQIFINKLRKAEKKAITSAKLEAIRLGANMISGFSLSISEATRASGMLMVSCAGTAILYGQPPKPLAPNIEKYEREIEQIQSKIAELSSTFKIIIAASSERYHELENELGTSS